MSGDILHGCQSPRVAWAGSSASAVVVAASETFPDGVILSDGVYIDTPSLRPQRNILQRSFCGAYLGFAHRHG